MKAALSCCVSLVLSVGLLACGSKKEEKPATPPKAPAAANAAKKAPAATPVEPKKTPKTAQAAACTAGASKCDGKYAGKVRKGNNPPLGANVMRCKDGKWALERACDKSKNEGCYVLEDPGSGKETASCGDAMTTGE